MFAEFSSDSLGAQFRKSVSDAQSFSSQLFPGASEFSRHLLMAQREVLLGFTSLVNAQLESIEHWSQQSRHSAAHPDAEAVHATVRQTPERVRVEVSEEHHQPEHPRKKAHAAAK
jgi:hypothetical protein